MNEPIEQFYERLLNLGDGWRVDGVERDEAERRVLVGITYDDRVFRCPVCGGAAKFYDKRTRQIRHLDTCDYFTILNLEYPRVTCAWHGVQPVEPVERASGNANEKVSCLCYKNSRYTNAFEQRVVDLCEKTPTQKVAKDMRLHWYAVQGIKDRVYERRLREQRGKKPEKVEDAFVDDKSMSKGHNGVTTVGNAKTGKVLAVIPDMKAESLTRWFATQQVADFSELRSISMDMAPAYIKAARDAFPNADQIICFDRFHVAQLFSRALDAVRRKESAYYNRAGKENPFKKTRFDWLRNNERADNRTTRRRRFHALRRGPLKNTQTARVWELKEAASRLWDLSKGRDARGEWERLLRRLSHSRIAEMKKLYRTIKEHLDGILNAIRLRASNAVAEARNSAIQRLKFMGCGFWNQTHFIREILFQFGGLVY